MCKAIPPMEINGEGKMQMFKNLKNKAAPGLVSLKKIRGIPLAPRKKKGVLGNLHLFQLKGNYEGMY